MLQAVMYLKSYAKAPGAMFTMRHPVKAIRMMRARRAMRHAFAPRRVAMGLGAAALAVPFGLWVGRRLRSEA